MSTQGGEGGAEGPAVASRSLLIWDQPPEVSFGAYGYLIYTSMVPEYEDELREKYRLTCEAFFSRLSPSSEFSHRPPSEHLTVFWPLRAKPFEGELPRHVSSALCEDLIAAYDYATAHSVASDVGSPAVVGPLLVGCAGYYTPGRCASPTLVLDMSSFSNDDITRIVRLWIKHVLRDPEEWRDGWKLAVFKEKARSLLNRYGETVMRIFGD